MRIIYKIESEKLKKIAREAMEDRKEMIKKAKKLSKQVGASPTKMYISRGFSADRVVAFHFEKAPDGNLWKKHSRCGTDKAYCPSKKTRIGKELAEKFEKLAWKPTKLEEALKWEDIHDHTIGRFYSFSLGVSSKRDFFCFAAPALDDKKKRYKPIKGLKEITIGEMEKGLGTI